MKHTLLKSLALIALLSATSAWSLTINYEGCKIPPESAGEKFFLVPIKVIGCDGHKIAKIKINPTVFPQTLNIPVPANCDHYIVNFDTRTSGSLGTDCSFNVKANSVVTFKDTYKGCLCQFEKNR